MKIMKLYNHIKRINYVKFQQINWDVCSRDEVGILREGRR